MNTCMIEECQRARYGYGMCRKHWRDSRKDKDRTRSSWYHMKQRVLNPNSDVYHHYGGRGINICVRWLDSFENFLEDMGERPVGLSLDRVNNDGNYTPENCRWATQSDQVRNRRRRNNSGHTGVWFDKDRNKWEAKIRIQGKTHHLGRFPDLSQAIEARKTADLKYGFSPQS